METKIYGLVDPREPDHVRYIGAFISEPSKLIEEDFSNIFNGDRKRWLRLLKSEGVLPEVVILQEGVDDLYYTLKQMVREYWNGGHQLFNLKHWVMTKKVNKLDQVRIKVMIGKLRKLFPEVNFVAMYDENNWNVMCNDYEFYTKNKKFKVWKKLLHKKTPIKFVFCYSSNANKEISSLQKQYKNYIFI